MTTKTDQKKTQATIDPDAIGWDDPAYWAATLVYAIKRRNRKTEAKARENLRRLGFELRRADQ
jgi:hypothetical protein